MMRARFWPGFGQLLGAGVLSLFAPALLGVAALWLVASESGLQAVAQAVQQMGLETPYGRLQWQGVEGRLLGPLRIARIETIPQRPNDVPLRIEGLQLSWQPLALLEGRLRLHRLEMARLYLPENHQPSHLPQSLQLPLALDVEQLRIGALYPPVPAADVPLLQEVQATLHSDGRQHVLSKVQARWQELPLTASARLDGVAPFALTARLDAPIAARISPELSWPALELTASATGTLQALTLQLRGQPAAAHARDTFTLQGEARLAPFAAQPLQAITLTAHRLAPQMFHPSAPQALLTARIDAQPDAAGALAGTLQLDNARPAALDRQGLPLERLHTRLRLLWQERARQLQLNDLQIQAGKGQLRGQVDLHWPVTGDGKADGAAGWPQGQVQLSLQQLDLATWHSRLRPTRLNGTINFVGTAQQGQTRLAVRDDHLQLDGMLQHDPHQLTLSRLELQQGRARLTAHGQWSLAAPQPWQLDGQLHAFDPSLLAAVPPATIHAQFAARGQRLPHLQGTLQASIDDSQWAGAALAGQTTLSFDGLEQPDDLWAANGRAYLRGQLQLTLARSRLELKGGWGGPQEHLALHLESADLARHRALLGQWPGLAGQLALDATLAGMPTRPRLTIQGQAQGLTLPGGQHVQKLKLSAQGEQGGPGAALERLEVRLTAEGVHVPGAPPLLERLELQLDGSQARHTLRATAQGLGQHWAMQASGGLQRAGDWRDAAWQGRLEQLTVEGNSPGIGATTTATTTATASSAAAAPVWLALLQPLRLQAATGLSIQRQAVTLQPAQFVLAGGQLELSQTQWSPQQWQTRGQFRDLDLMLPAVNGATNAAAPSSSRARAAGAWQLVRAADGALSGRIQARLPELRGLAAAIDPGYTSAGQLEADIHIAGSQQQPRLRGELNGRQLAFGIPAQGLQLSGGTLRLRLEEERAILEQLRFTAAHHPPARALRETGYVVPDTPGWLECSGTLRPWQQEAQLEVKLSGLPVLQRQDRWLVVSGTGRIDQEAQRLRLTGQLLADAGFVGGLSLDQPQLAEDVVIRGRGPRPARTSRVDTDLSLDLGERFRLDVAGLRARLAGRVSVRGAPLRASGSIAAQEASFEAYGQRLTVARGIVNFQGPLDNPGLNILALRTGGEVEAGVSVTGTVQRPQVRLVSTPDVPDPEKLSWIVLGRPPDSGGTDAGILLAAAGSLLGQGGESLTTQVARGFGLDEVSLHRSQNPGEAAASPNGNGLDQQVLTLGKRLSSRLYLSYDQGLSAARGALKLTYALGRRLSIMTRTGDDNAVDVLYSFSFD